MDIYERLALLCKKKGVRPNVALKSVGVSPSLATELKMGRVKSISSKNAKKIADYFDVSVEYLLYGDESSPEQANMKSIKIPVYGVIAAGLPILAEQDIIDYEEIPEQMARSGEYFGLQVSGDSMEPRMFTGDVVILRKTDVFENGKICAVMVNGEEATLKRVIVRPGGITLVALNPKYAPTNFTAKMVEDIPVRCMGVAVEVRGKLML